MFIDDFVAPVTVYAVTPKALETITGLTFRGVSDRSSIPPGPGVYVWAKSREDAIIYPGVGKGQNGLYARLGNELRWRDEGIQVRDEWLADARRRGVEADLLGKGSLLAHDYVPFVRAVVDHDLKCFAASTLDDSDATEDGLAQTTPSERAEIWEKRIIMVNRQLSGNGSIIGGNAWELRGDAWWAADQWAWTRLCQLRDAASTRQQI